MSTRACLLFLLAALVALLTAGAGGAQDTLPRAGLGAPLPVQEAAPVGEPLRQPAVATVPAGPPLPTLPAPPEQAQLPINLATALRLAEARPLVIAAAQASLRVALAQLDGAKALWLPNVYVGGSYYYHLGGAEGNSGDLFVNSRNQLLLGGGVTATFAVADAIFAPLALQQVVKARTYDVQTARNDALRSVGESYFNVQEARGRLAGAEEVVGKATDLARRIRGLTKVLVAPVEINRTLTELADLEQELAQARGRWRVTSADLTRLLRLDPRAVVVPLEPPYLQVTLIAPEVSLDTLVTVGLTNRPELARQQALVQATLVRLKQERLRPLIPSVVLLGDAVPTAPGGSLMGGVYGSNLNGQGNPWTGRFDPSVQVLWELRNLGLGNRALVRERQAQSEQAEIDLFREQDRIAAEVVQAQAEVETAAARVERAVFGLKEARVNFDGNLKGISETTRVGETLTLVNRPQEAVSALRQLNKAYDNYFTSVNEYNRAQFRLYFALGYPPNLLNCERSLGPVQPVNTTRPALMAPVPHE